MKVEKRMIICILCPKGCEVSVTVDAGNVSKIEGKVCKLGRKYAKNEILNPKRIVTTTVKVQNGSRPLVPVWTIAPIPKDKIFELINMLREIKVDAPIKRGDKILTAVFGTDVEASDENPELNPD